MDSKAIVAEKAQKLKQMTAAFCDKYVDEEYKHLCEKLIAKMPRKRNVPFISGRLEIWAAAIVHAIGSINFLFDKSSQPYASIDDISSFFGTSKSTVSQKSKVIRDMFKLGYWDKEFSTAMMQEGNPLADTVVIDGFIVPICMLTPEMQERLRSTSKP